MKIDNYFFASLDGKPILDKSGDFCLVGEIYGREGFNDGSTIQTSRIVKLDEASVTTKSGSVYEFDTMHPDYEEMLDAVEAGKTIIFDWSAKHKKTWDDNELIIRKLLGEKITKNHILSGKDQSGKFIVGEVVGQNGNYVTLAIHHRGSVEYTEELEVFVAWRSMSFNTDVEIMCFHEGTAGIPYENFEESFGSKCRPKFPV